MKNLLLTLLLLPALAAAKVPVEEDIVAKTSDPDSPFYYTSLMMRYNVPLRNVVPHNYWSGKNCPAPLMTNGRPGYKWSWFISRVDYYYRCLQAGK